MLYSTIKKWVIWLCHQRFLGKESDFRTNRARRCLRVLFQRSIWAVSLVSLLTERWVCWGVSQLPVVDSWLFSFSHWVIVGRDIPKILDNPRTDDRSCEALITSSFCLESYPLWDCSTFRDPQALHKYCCVPQALCPFFTIFSLPQSRQLCVWVVVIIKSLSLNCWPLPFYFDESGFSLEPQIPYAWQPLHRPIVLPSSKSKRINVLGLLSKTMKFKSYTFESSIDSSKVIQCFDEFSNHLERPTFIVLDNAPIHHK